MTTFPTLYRHGTEVHNPVVRDLTDQIAIDPAIRSQSEGGYTTSRARFSRIRRKWGVQYEWLSQANKNTVMAFEEARFGGSDAFTWTNPETGTDYTVRFLDVIEFIPHEHANFRWWSANFVLEEV